MSIKKGLIIFRAERHQRFHPDNLKCRYYSNKISLPPKVLEIYPGRSIRQMNQPKIIKIAKIAKTTKLVQSLSLDFQAEDLNKTQILRYFSKFHRVRKLSIQNDSLEILKDLVISLFKKAFKTLKSLEQIHLKNLGLLQKDPKTFKNLVLQRSLQKFIVSPLKFTEDVASLEPFLKFSQAFEKRKCWPHLKYLRLDFEYFREYIGHQSAHRNHRASLDHLFKFLQGFKVCESLYKCSHFQLELPQEINSGFSATETVVFDGILKLKPPFTQISALTGENISNLFQAAQHFKNLKSLDLSFSDELSDYLKMDSLGKFPALQEMSLVINCGYDFDDESPEAHFSYFALEKMASMKNLRRMSLFFDGDPGGIADLLHNALSKLTELTYLKLQFSNMIPFEYQSEEDYDNEDDDDPEEDEGREERECPSKLSWPWLKEVFQSIGKMKKLKELSLSFETFGFQDSSGLFKSLCQALGKLTHLSSLWLSLADGEYMKDEDLNMLISYLGKLKMMESLFIRISKSSFKPKLFGKLMDTIVKNLKILSELDLNIRFSDVTKQWHQVVYQGIRQMRCLNRMKVGIGGKMGKGVSLALLEDEIRKKTAGTVMVSQY